MLEKKHIQGNTVYWHEHSWWCNLKQWRSQIVAVLSWGLPGCETSQNSFILFYRTRLKMLQMCFALTRPPWLNPVGSPQLTECRLCSLQIYRKEGPQPTISHNFIIKAFSPLKNHQYMCAVRMKPPDAGHFVSPAVTSQHGAEKFREKTPQSHVWSIISRNCIYPFSACLLACLLFMLTSHCQGKLQTQ